MGDAAAGNGRRTEELAALMDGVLARFDAAHRAREVGLAACRRTIRACGQAIRAVHRHQPEAAAALTEEARVSLREAQSVLQPHPSVAYAGFLHDAEKEYVEAVLTAAMVEGQPLASAVDIGVEPASWLKGLCEAASELRRHLLDRLRAGELARAESLLLEMEDVYDQLVTVDYPDAITAGLRRAVDALRAVLERSRADVTTTVLQARLQASLDRASDSAGG